MDNITNFPDQKTKPPKEEEEEEDQEEEEALSLCDFPLNSNEPEKKDSSKIIQDKRRSSSEPSDFFEFFNDHISSEMSNAEDIIFRGKLVPYKNPPRFQHQILKSLSADDATHLSRTYSESLPELNPARSNSRRLTRNSRSMDWKKSRRNSSPLIMKPEASDIHRSFSKSSAKSEGSKLSKPRWFVLMFGPLKLQPEMDLRDMKNRQVRRNPGRLFPGMDAGGKNPASRSDRRSSWGHDLLRVLSCKNHASVAVTASIGLVPHFWGKSIALTWSSRESFESQFIFIILNLYHKLHFGGDLMLCCMSPPLIVQWYRPHILCMKLGVFISFSFLRISFPAKEDITTGVMKKLESLSYTLSRIDKSKKIVCNKYFSINFKVTIHVWHIASVCTSYMNLLIITNPLLCLEDRDDFGHIYDDYVLYTLMMMLSIYLRSWMRGDKNFVFHIGVRARKINEDHKGYITALINLFSPLFLLIFNLLNRCKFGS